MRRLLNKSVGPPQLNGYSFRYTHSDGHVSKANDWWTWEDMIRKHILAMNLRMPADLMGEAEDQLCGTIPAHLSQFEIDDPAPVDVRIETGDVINWIKSVAGLIFSGDGYVSQDEAERRAGICVACPFNVEVVGGCGRCQSLVEAMTPGMSQRSTTQDGRLRSCAICKCFGRVAVHFPIAILTDDDKKQAVFPEFCWRKIDGTNYIA